MKSHASNDFDREMMKRCICIAVQSGNDREYPYGVILCRDGKIVAESTNRVAHERDVTRHAEVVVISRAQQILGTNSLSDCVIYVSAEPCVYCCYAIRESRIGRVVYGLHSPQMGGVSRWSVLTDEVHRRPAVAGARHGQRPNVSRPASVSCSHLTSTWRLPAQMRSVTEVASPLSTNPDMTVDFKPRASKAHRLRPRGSLPAS